MRKRILVVEDDVDQQLMLQVALEQSGYTVITTLSGQRALAYASFHAVDLMLLDVSLDSAMDGLGGARAAQGERGDSSHPRHHGERSSR